MKPETCPKDGKPLVRKTGQPHTLFCRVCRNEYPDEDHPRWQGQVNPVKRDPVEIQAECDALFGGEWDKR